MDKIILNLENRAEKGKQNRRLRASGKVPAVVYGHGSDPQAVAADAKMIEKVYSQAGGNKIVGIKIGDDKQKNALFQDIQIDSRTGHLTHADLYLVRMDEKIKTEVPVHMVGESTAVYQQEGTLIRPIETVEVEALPADLPENFEIDISVIDDFDKTITVGDLKVPQGVEILTAPEEVLAKVEPPRSDAELEELDSEVTEELPEGVAEDDEAAREDGPQTDKEPQNKDAGANPEGAK
ncbi:MAG TPA: 50S ribosomal protein L25 [Candidatus Saccharimonadales bacterium]|nr:50S ribosomal protein L25 [Candidatus Saccharimonadales bacterium]